ncbi:MAG: hypothetical protein ACLFVN_11910 [Phycisphaeraceae bacterium]
MDHDEAARVFGFSPWTASPTARAWGVIDRGPRRGYLAVFTDDRRVDPHATAKPNFVDADLGGEPYREGSGYTYIFSPVGGVKG